MFLTRLTKAILTNDTKAVDNIIAATQHILLHFSLDLNVINRYCDNNRKTKVYELVDKNQDIVKRIFLSYQGQKTLIPAFYHAICSNNLDLVKFFVEKAKVPLTEPCNESGMKFPNPLLASRNDLKVFKYLFPYYYTAHKQLKNNDATQTDEFVNILKKHLLDSYKHLQHAIPHIDYYLFLARIFENCNDIDLYSSIATAFENIRQDTLDMLSDFLISVVSDDKKIQQFDRKKIDNLTLVIKIIFSLINEEQSDKLNLIATFKSIIVPKYLSIISTYRKTHLDNAYEIAEKFLAKNKLDINDNNNCTEDKGCLIELKDADKGPSPIIMTADILNEFEKIAEEHHLNDELEKFLISQALEGNALAFNSLLDKSYAFDSRSEIELLIKISRLYLNGKGEIDKNKKMALKYLINSFSTFAVDRHNFNKLGLSLFNELYDLSYTFLTDSEVYSSEKEFILIRLLTYLLNQEDIDKINKLLDFNKIKIYCSDDFINNFISFNIDSIYSVKNRDIFKIFLCHIDKIVKHQSGRDRLPNSNNSLFLEEVLESILRNFDLSKKDFINELKLILNAFGTKPFEMSERLYQHLISKNYSLEDQLKANCNYFEAVGYGAENKCDKCLYKLDEIFLKIYQKDVHPDLKNALADQYKKLLSDTSIKSINETFNVKILLLTNVKLTTPLQKLSLLEIKLSAWAKEALLEHEKLSKQNSNMAVKNKIISFFNKGPDTEDVIVNSLMFVNQIIAAISNIINDSSSLIKLDISSKETKLVNIETIEDIYSIIMEYLSLPASNIEGIHQVLSKLNAIFIAACSENNLSLKIKPNLE